MLGCMLALLFARASTQLVDVNGGTAPQWAEVLALLTCRLGSTATLYLL